MVGFLFDGGWGSLWRMGARARGLVMEDGKVRGVYATDGDGNDIKVNAKAVILATGGYAQNEKFMTQRGWNWDDIVYGGLPHHEGDGLEMAFAAGAGNTVANSSFNCTNILGQGNTFAWKQDNFTSLFLGAGMFGLGGNVLWVNQDADRFIDESFAASNFEMQSVPAMTQRAIYSVFDRAIAEAALGAADDAETLDKMDAAVADGTKPDRAPTRLPRRPRRRVWTPRRSRRASIVTTSCARPAPTRTLAKTPRSWCPSRPLLSTWSR